MSKSKFNFFPIDGGYEVRRGRTTLGTIHPLREPTGRHCFRLGFDTRKNPRTYRGKEKAALALAELNVLAKAAEKKPTEQIIIEAWDHKPASSPQWG